MAVFIHPLQLRVQIYGDSGDNDFYEITAPITNMDNEGEIVGKILAQLTTFELRSLRKLKILNSTLTPCFFNTNGWVYFDRRNLKAWSNYIFLNELIASRNPG